MQLPALKYVAGVEGGDEGSPDLGGCLHALRHTGGESEEGGGGGTKGGRASMLARVAGTRSQVTSLVMASDALPFS